MIYVTDGPACDMDVKHEMDGKNILGVFFFEFCYTHFIIDISSDITNYNIYNRTKQLGPLPYINPLKYLPKYFKPSLIFEKCLLHSHFVKERQSSLN